jgi:hypothetical protein
MSAIWYAGVYTIDANKISARWRNSCREPALAPRWDTEHGRALLLTRQASTNNNAGMAPLQGSLVSYLAAPQVTP